MVTSITLRGLPSKGFRRERMSKVRSEVDRKSFDVALEQLDETTRTAVLSKLGEIRGMVERIEPDED